MGLLLITATGICSMMGASINVIPFMIQKNIPGIGPYVVPAFLFAAIPAVFAAFAYAILSSAMPRAGGSYLYASRGLSPYLGFIASFSQWFGLSIVIGFAFILGFGATLAEPALNALGSTVQTLTNGAFKKSMLMYSVAGGVAVGIALGVSKVVLGFDLMKVLLPLYVLGIVLTVFSTEEFVNVAWDSAGVTTGPVTVPLVLAMGLGLGNAVSAIDGFGILSLASICPIVAVLSMGLVIRFINKKADNPVAV